MKVLIVAGYHKGRIIDVLYGDTIRMPELIDQKLDVRLNMRTHLYVVRAMDEDRTLGFGFPNNMTEAEMLRIVFDLAIDGARLR